MNLKEFIEKGKEDSNLFWRLSSGEHQNLLDEAIEKLENAEANNQSGKAGVRPCGLNDNDTIEDALQRADDLAGVDWHSGSMCDRKDLRRIVLLAYEYRKLTSG